MSSISLCLDEDVMDDSLVQALRSRNVDVVTAAEANMLHRDDDKQLTWSTTNHRVLYSFNLGDFYALHTIHLEQEIIAFGNILAPQQRYGNVSSG